jgi:hypothetical protein
VQAAIAIEQQDRRDGLAAGLLFDDLRQCRQRFR